MRPRLHYSYATEVCKTSASVAGLVASFIVVVIAPLVSRPPVCEFFVCTLQHKHEVGLTPKMFSEGLSLLCKTGDGLAHAFVRLDVTNRYTLLSPKISCQ